MEFEEGTEIGKYEVVSFLGEGSMARVYKVRHRELKATYALKVLQASRKSIKERLLVEGQVQASLRHRNIVSVTDTVVIDGQPALVMEFIDGMDLDELIVEKTPLSLEDIASIGKGIIRGVRAAHKSGNLHRDLKPANVMMVLEDDEWVPKVADFGLAKAMGTELGGMGATRTGQIMGSPAYMSPEQARDSKNVDERTDIFALGCILYELATGERTFDGPDILSTMARIASGTFKPVEQLRPELASHQVKAIHGALVVDADKRIPNCDALLDVWTGRATFEVAADDPKATLGALFGQTIDLPGGLGGALNTVSDGTGEPRRSDKVPQSVETLKTSRSDQTIRLEPVEPSETGRTGPLVSGSAETLVLVDQGNHSAPKRVGLGLRLAGMSAFGVVLFLGVGAVTALAAWMLWPPALEPPARGSDVIVVAPIPEPPARPLPCAELPTRGELASRLVEMSAVPGKGATTFAREGLEVLGCAPFVLEPGEVAGVFRARGWSGLQAGDDKSGTWLATAYGVQPDHVYEPPLPAVARPAWREAESIWNGRATQMLLEPESGTIHVNGVASRQAPENLPWVFQLVNDDGEALFGAVVEPGEPVPSYPEKLRKNPVKATPVPPPPPVKPAPAVLPSGEVKLHPKSVPDVVLVRDNKQYKPGKVPVGTYRAFAVFPSSPDRVESPKGIRVRDGRTIVLKCDRMSERCVTFDD